MLNVKMSPGPTDCISSCSLSNKLIYNTDNQHKTVSASHPVFHATNSVHWLESKSSSDQIFLSNPSLSLLSASVRYISVILELLFLLSSASFSLGKKNPDLPVTKATCPSCIPQSSGEVSEMAEMREVRGRGGTGNKRKR